MNTTYFIIPCGAAKTTHRAKARDLYVSVHFSHVLRAAEAEAAATPNSVVLILSAKHGLLHLDAEVDPYDVKMGDAEAITSEEVADTAADLGIEYGAQVYGMLPNAYREVLAEALAADDVLVHDIYEAAPGIGYQRGVASALLRTAHLEAA